MDWNEDGRKDLILGEREGHIRIYKNVGTDQAPLFNGYTNFDSASGQVFDCGLNAVPVIVDWNEDGKKDVLCGQDQGKIILLININTNADPAYASGSYTFIQDGGADLVAGTHASPTVVDWNRDGRKDLIVGNGAGNLLYYENKGTDASPVFNGSELLLAGSVPIDVTYNARPDVVDWNFDGVMDILCGNYSSSPDFTGYVIYFEAKGPLSIGSNFLQAAKGGSIALLLSAGTGNAFRDYIMLGTLSGTEPGIPLPGNKAVLPINWDAFTNINLLMINTPAFHGFLGTLESHGSSKAKFSTSGPLPSVMVGLKISFAYALNAPWDYASNAVNIEILP